MRSVVGVLFVLAAVLPAGKALAVDANANQRAEARRHYVEGVKHYDLAEYDDALREFKEAYRAAEDPAFLFNIAQCHRKLGNLQEAITFYRSFLRRAPASSNRPEVERRIAELERELQSRPAPLPPAAASDPQRAIATSATSATPAPPPPQPASAASPPSLLAAPAPADNPAPFYRRGWFWAVAGLVAAGAIATVIVLRPTGEQQLSCPDCAATAGVKEP